MAKNIKYIISPNYKELEGWIKDIEQWFPISGEQIFKGRNEVKIYEKEGIRINIKSFKKPHLINRIVYSFIRKSKAQRSFEYAQKLLSMGVSTPTPIAWVTLSENGLLNQAFYLSIHFEHQFSIREVLDYKVTHRDVIIREYVRYTYRELHKNGIYHLDYSPGNVLINQIGPKQYSFALIDLNRMKFQNISFTQGVKNFSQLSTDEGTLEIIAGEYASVCGQNHLVTEKLLKQFDEERKRFWQRKKRLKGVFFFWKK